MIGRKHSSEGIRDIILHWGIASAASASFTLRTKSSPDGVIVSDTGADA